MREHSRVELARKLAAHAEPEDDLDALLNELEAQGWLSDERAAQGLVRRRSDRLGAARVRQELQAKGLPAEVIAQALMGLGESEVHRATEVWRRKFSQAPTDATARAKQMRFLMARGFGAATASAVLKAAVLVAHGDCNCCPGDGGDACSDDGE
jgi:regulatory protein